ncbi:ABC transporter substrate-binding protein [Pseudoroseicyclus sp. H15]
MKRLLGASALALLPAPAMAQDYPLTIEHKFGTTVIEEPPERVASLDYNGADNLLALGVQPVAIRYWYGDYENAVWPWAEDLLQSEPEILRGALNFEQIAATEPDVIVALWSGITAEEYESLSLIAPVVAVPEGVGDYSLPWDQLALMAGTAVGRLDEAEAQVAEIEAEMQAIAARHPDWADKTAAVAYYYGDTPGTYTGEDIRPLLLSRLGLSLPEPVQALATGSKFAVTFSEEELQIVDADVLIWMIDETAGQRDKIEGLALRPALTAYQEGREIITDVLLSSAFSHASLLSIPYVLEELEPRITAAIDGDPATEVPD